jgi:oligopeptide transport system substrate-binding protein
MRVRTRTLGFVGVIGLALIASACSGDDNDGNGGSANGSPEGSIVVGGCNPQSALLPSATNHACGGEPLGAIFSMLVKYDPQTGEAVNEIAASIETEDNQTWTVRLNSGWTFHDGTPITAQSFVDAWTWTADGANAELAVNASFFSPIEGFAEMQAAGGEFSGLRVVDDLTFQVTLNQPESGFPQRLGYTAFAPLPESFYDDPEAFGEHPVGSGPFQLVEWSRDNHIELTAYDGFSGETTPRVQDVTFRMYQQNEAEYADLLADNVDVMTQLPAMALTGEAYKSDLGSRYLENEAGTVHFIGFPPAETDGDVADPNLRKAISMAINRQLIIDNIFQGVQEPATGWVSPVVDGFTPDQCGEFCEYDPIRAQELLDEAGVSGRITLTYNADDDHASWVRAACNSIMNALDGIECLPDDVPLAADYFDQIFAFEMEGMFRLAWNMDYPSIENFLAPLYASGASANFFGFDDDEFDDLLGQAATEDDGEAVALYQQAERLLADAMPTIPLWYDKTVSGYSSRIDGDTVQITPFRTLDLLSIATI